MVVLVTRHQVTSYLCRGCGLLLSAHHFGIRRTGKRAGQRLTRCKYCVALEARAYTKRKQLKAARTGGNGG